MPTYRIYHKRAMDGRIGGAPVLRVLRDWRAALEAVLRMGGERAVALYEEDAHGMRGPLNGNIDWPAVRMERKTRKAKGES